MNYNIRLYKQEEYPMLHAWNAFHGEFGPTKDLIPLESSFVLEMEGIPALFLSVVCSNTPGMCALVNYCGNPKFAGKRQELSKLFIDYAANYAKECGYTSLLGFAFNPKLEQKYITDFGFNKIMNNVSILKRDI